MEPNMENKTNTTCGYTELSPEQDEFLKNYTWCVDMLGNLFVGVLGVVLNSITVIVLSTSTMRNNFFNRLLICLAVFDNLYLFCELSEVLRLRYYTFLQQHMFAYFIYPVRSVFLYSSIYMTVALTLERYHAIASPVQYRARGTTNMTSRLLRYVVPILALSVIYYIPKLLDMNVDEVTKCKGNNATTVVKDEPEFNQENRVKENCTTEYHLTPTPLRMEHYYVLWYINISNLILTAFIPLGVLICLNCKIYLSLNQFIQRQPSAGTRTSRRQRLTDVKKTFILFSIVAVFVICHSLRIILNVNEFFNLTTYKEEHEKGCDGVKFWAQVIVPLNQLLVIINASANFFIYVFFDKGFQQVLQQVCIIKSERHGHTLNNGLQSTTTRVTLKHNATNEIELSVMNGNIDV